MERRVAGVMVSIAAFQAVDPGSIPGPRIFVSKDNVAEWFRRQPAKLMGFARVGSNPTVVDFLLANQKNKPQAGFEPTCRCVR